MAAAEASAGGGLAAFVSGKNMKIFAAAVSAIAKIGKDLYLDASDDGVSCGVLPLRLHSSEGGGRSPPKSRRSRAWFPPDIAICESWQRFWLDRR